MPGAQVGRARPDHWTGAADLGCTTCGATWVGDPGEPCWWCERRDEAQRERRRWTALQPPEDMTPATVAGWAQVLADGIAVGLFDEREATRAMERWLNQHQT